MIRESPDLPTLPAHSRPRCIRQQSQCNYCKLDRHTWFSTMGIIWTSFSEITSRTVTCSLMVRGGGSDEGNFTHRRFYHRSKNLDGPDSSVGIATELRAGQSGDRIPVGTRFSSPRDRPWSPPSLLYNGYRVFPGGKVRPGRAADHTPPSNAAVMEG